MNKCCNKCHQSPCGCPEPILAITDTPHKDATLTFNDNGKLVDYDYTNMIEQTQTDTFVTIDLIKRLLVHSAERHTDTITAQELASILHLGEIGDVDAKGLQEGSQLVYKQNNNCAQGCTGTSNKWVAWSIFDDNSQVTSFDYPCGYDTEGHLRVLQQPTQPNQTYLLGWNGGNHVSYFQPAIATVPPANGYRLYMDGTSRAIIAVKENS